MTAATLDAWLTSYCSSGDPTRRSVADTTRIIAQAALSLNKIILDPQQAVSHGRSRGANADGDIQADLDVIADEAYHTALKAAPVAFYASEERTEAVRMTDGAPLAVAIDPLDGSSNIDTNVSVGTIFSFLPAMDDAEQTFLQPGKAQLGAGFVMFGPRLTLVVNLGLGTAIFAFSPRFGAFVQIQETVLVPKDCSEFAINASNYRHWDEFIRLYVDDCIQGEEGPRGRDYNMRWIASLVADAYRILVRGGVFLYPRDSRKNYHQGRLRLIYEANPIALVMEGAGASATDGYKRILDIEPTALHQRTPLVFGSAGEVRKIGRYYEDPAAIGYRQPLFGHRGLFRS